MQGMTVELYTGGQNKAGLKGWQGGNREKGASALWDHGGTKGKQKATVTAYL